MTGFVIAIDGPAASGKGSIAAFLGRRLGLPVLDTGLLYRAVGVAVATAGGDVGDADAAGAAARVLVLDDLRSETLRTRSAGEAASRVAVHASVRAALLEAQRVFARRPGGAILDGRDIGTVVAPEAPCKLFITASPEARASRRHAQLRGQGETVKLEELLEDIRRRDARDGERNVAPMKRAPDAALLDTTDLDIDAAFDAALRIVEASRNRWEKS
jgi:cytidylate kinase